MTNRATHKTTPRSATGAAAQRAATSNAAFDVVSPSSRGSEQPSAVDISRGAGGSHTLAPSPRTQPPPRPTAGAFSSPSSNAAAAIAASEAAAIHTLIDPSAQDKLRAVEIETQLKQQAVRDTMLQNASLTKDIETLHRLLASARDEVKSLGKRIEDVKHHQMIRRFTDEQATAEQRRVLEAVAKAQSHFTASAPTTALAYQRAVTDALATELETGAAAGGDVTADPKNRVAFERRQQALSAVRNATAAIEKAAGAVDGDLDAGATAEQHVEALMRRKLSLPELELIVERAKDASGVALRESNEASNALQKVFEYRARVEAVLSKQLSANEQLAQEVNTMKKHANLQQDKASQECATHRPLERDIRAAEQRIQLVKREIVAVEKQSEKVVSRQRRFDEEIHRMQKSRVEIRQNTVSEVDVSERKQALIDTLRAENQELVQWLVDDADVALEGSRRRSRSAALAAERDAQGITDPDAIERERVETAARLRQVQQDAAGREAVKELQAARTAQFEAERRGAEDRLWADMEDAMRHVVRAASEK